jgi:hypothetical protein
MNKTCPACENGTPLEDCFMHSEEDREIAQLRAALSESPSRESYEMQVKRGDLWKATAGEKDATIIGLREYAVLAADALTEILRVAEGETIFGTGNPAGKKIRALATAALAKSPKPAPDELCNGDSAKGHGEIRQRPGRERDTR